MNFIPTVIQKTSNGEKAYDLFSRLLNERIIYLTGPVDEAMATSITAQLLFLDAENHDDISIYINSPGGSVTAGLAIYDVMQHVTSDVSTICMGLAASMGAFLLTAGAKNKRYILPNAEVMIHQPSGGAQGQATDIHIVAENILRTRERLNQIMANNTGQTIEQIALDTERDNYMTAEQAKEYGLIDQILYPVIKSIVPPLNTLQGV